MPMKHNNSRVTETKMGRTRRTREKHKDTVAESFTLPPSRSHSFSSSSSSSSSDFEFSISISPRKSSTDLLCPADELFYKGKLLPLHLSPRISMVRTLLLSSSYSAPRDSTASTTSSCSSSFLANDCDSSRPSSATDDDNHFTNRHHNINNNAFSFTCNKKTTTNKYFSFSRFSSVFRKPRGETESISANSSVPSSVKRMGSTAREVIRKYFKKVKNPLHSKFSQKQQKTVPSSKTERSANGTGVSSSGKKKEITESSAVVPSSSSSSSSSYSFSGNLLYPRRRSSYVSSCPSSMRSSPTHSGVLSRGASYADASTIEELQSAIQGAIAHCKNSLLQNETVVSSSEI